MNRKELSEVIAECAARTERAAALSAEAAARSEAAAVEVQEARVRQEAAVARQEAATAKMEEIQAGWAERDRKQDEMFVEMKKRAEEDRAWREEFLRRQEKMFQAYLRRADQTLTEIKQQTAEIIAELHDQRDERRALKEAILRLIDRLPPPPPHLRSA